jgi:hypothetical protein
MLSGSDNGLGGGLSCPEKDRCTNYSCAGGFLRVFREWISGFHDRLRTRPLKRRSTIILHGSTTQKTALNIILAAVRT